MCHVEGGPNYEVTLIGDSSLITYRLSTNHIELGDIRFCDWLAREFIIENTGKVTFEYKILYIAVKRKGYIECTPSYGNYFNYTPPPVKYLNKITVYIDLLYKKLHTIIYLLNRSNPGW